MNDKIRDIIDVLNEMYPNPECELNHNSDLELVIAVLLSAQTTDISVNKVTATLFKKYQTLDDYINVDQKELENDLRSIGLYKNKAKNIKILANQIKNDFNGQVPGNLSDLESLAGVGRKTANVVLSVAFDVPAIAVDTHVNRVAKRLKLAYQKDDVLTVERKLEKKFPKDIWTRLHHQMVFFGRYHCKAKKPECDGCPLKIHCRYPNIDDY